ncbi:MAG TPA: glycosyl hydrolase family 18 protein [Candidatus Paceibacterota bacterium]|nr:glycosyl hydrolase family 18 protein [Candidatus Paceibacterota bacterium]
MNRSFTLFALTALIGATALIPTSARAAELEVSGWIPYWAVSAGVREAGKHLDELSVIHPFSYSVNTDGKPKDLANMGKSSWQRLIRNAKADGVAVIPTIMWSDTNSIHRILSDEKLRAAHVKAIADLVKKEKYDGIDIDYEGKLAKTRPYYSLFLKELDSALGAKTLSCTIEARTPPESLYTTIPATLEYANDFGQINKYCDRVTLMTYDQQRADLKLNSARSGAPYYPIADLEWVKKVVALASKSIDKNKLVIGVATYGREVEVTVSPNWFQAYRQISSVSDEYARDTADKHDADLFRNGAGELSYSYAPDKATQKLLASVSLPKSTRPRDEAAARALAYADKTGNTVKIRTVWWSDAKAIEEKADLARALGVKGIAIFKIDGGADEDLWDSF